MGADTISVLVRMRTTDGVEAAHECYFTADEWELLGRFASFAEELSGTTCLKTNRRLSFQS